MRVQLTTRESLFFEALIGFLLTAVLVTIYWQVTGFEFIKLDDPRYVTENPTIKQGITLHGIRWAFMSFYAANWHPMTWISHMLDVQLFGMKPGMHHLTNLFFHIINTLLVFSVFNRMTGALWRSAAVAALFALHPLHVESVAWVSERKDVLSTFFWLLTMMAYLWYVQKINITRYLVVVFFYILGLLSKPMLVTLPFVLILFDYWPLKRFDSFKTIEMSPNNDKTRPEDTSTWHIISSVILDKIPLIFLALISSVITFLAQKGWGAVASFIHIPISTRIGNAAIAYITYLGKMFYPAHLAVFYPYPEVLHPYSIVLCLMVLLLITVLILIFKKKVPYLIVGWLWYIGTLVPVIGIIQVGQQSMADRYMYIPLIGIFIIVVWGLSDIFSRWDYGKATLGVVSVVIFMLLSWTTWGQLSSWKNNETLFKHALLVTTNNDVAFLNVGYALLDKGDVDGAIKNYLKALQIDPANSKVYVNLGEAYEARKDTKTAIYYYLKGLEYDPNNAYAHTALGTILASVGNTDEAIKHFHEAIKINQEYIEAHNNLGNLMLNIGNYDEAIKSYTEALSIDPHQAIIHNNLGTAFIYKGNIQKAIKSYQESLRRQPDFAGAINNLKIAKTNQEILEGLLVKTQGLIKSDPRNPALYTKLGDIYRQLGEDNKSISQYNEAISIQENYSQALFGLVQVYSNCQEYMKAIDVLERMNQFQPGNPDIDYNIACIYAKQNMTDDSIEWLKRAINKGFHNWDLMKKDPDLINIRNSSYVNGLMKNH